MTDSTGAVLTAVALVEAWLDERVTSSLDVLLPDEDDADPLRDIGALIALAGSFAERAARAQGADDVTRCAHELLDADRQRALHGRMSPPSPEDDGTPRREPRA